MELPRFSNMQYLAISKFIGMISLYLGSLIKSVLKTLLLMILRSLVSICLWCQSEKGKVFYICMVDSLGLLRVNPNIDC